MNYCAQILKPQMQALHKFRLPHMSATNLSVGQIKVFPEMLKRHLFV